LLWQGVGFGSPAFWRRGDPLDYRRSSRPAVPFMPLHFLPSALGLVSPGEPVGRGL